MRLFFLLFIISCITEIIRVGATPVLVDINPDTWNMDVSQIESKITPKTKAIMVVHIYGLPVDMNPVLEIASNYGLQGYRRCSRISWSKLE